MASKLTKRELVDIVSRKAHLTKKAASEAVDVLLEEIGRQLSRGVNSKVVLSGFGTFRTIRMKEKTVKVPDSDQMVTIKPHLSPRFTPGKRLKRQVSR
jgi:nucleoid DNA-binding protein